MAEENKEAKTETNVSEPKKSIKKWVILGSLLLFLSGGGYAAWEFFLAEKFLGSNASGAADSGNKQYKKKDVKFGIIHQMEPFIVNLTEPGGKRYLKTRIEIEVEDDYIQEELLQRRPQLRDAVLLILTSKTFKDVSSLSGKIQLRNELVARVNQILQEGSVRTLYFTEFVVQ